VLVEQPPAPVGRRLLGLGQRPFGVPADEDGGDRELADQAPGLFGQRPPGEVAAENDELRPLSHDLLSHGFECHGVPVNVGENGDASCGSGHQG